MTLQPVRIENEGQTKTFRSKIKLDGLPITKDLDRKGQPKANPRMETRTAKEISASETVA